MIHRQPTIDTRKLRIRVGIKRISLPAGTQPLLQKPAVRIFKLPPMAATATGSTAGNSWLAAQLALALGRHQFDSVTNATTQSFPLHGIMAYWGAKIYLYTVLEWRPVNVTFRRRWPGEVQPDWMIGQKFLTRCSGMPQSGHSSGRAITVPIVVKQFFLPPSRFEGKCPASNQKQSTVPSF